jgi:hypothetical protein
MSELPRQESFEDLPLLAELRERLQARFLVAERPEVARALRGHRPASRARLLLALAALLLVGGTATAAVTLSGTRSAPLSGSVPGHRTGPEHGLGFTESGRRYRIVFAPQLSGGEAGWKTFIAFGQRGGLQTAAGGEGGYPTRAAPLAGGAGVGFTSTPLPGGEVVDYVLAAPRVAAVRLGDRTIRTRSDPALPAGDRVAVFFVPAGSPPVTIPPPGARPPYLIRVPAMASPSPRRSRRGEGTRRPATSAAVEHRLLTLRGRRRPHGLSGGASSRSRTVLIRTTPLIPLDRDGRPIPYAPPRPGRSVWRTGAWQARRAGEGHPGAAATHSLPGACEIARHGLPALRPEWGHVLEAIPAVPDAEGELFLSCVDTEYFLHGWPLDAAILLDAREPGRALGPIPGAGPVAGHPGLVDVALGSPPGDLTARRVGNAWLVVEGGSGLAQRLEVLGALRIAKLSLTRR